MLRKKKGEIEWLEFEHLSCFPELSHGIFLRKGGVSEGSYASLNVSYLSGDCPKKVEENRRRILNVLNLPHLTSATQVHGNKALIVNEMQTPECDALITNRSHHPLMVSHADCQATLFFDPVTRVCANIHAGWRGLVSEIYAKTLQQMVTAFHCQPKNILVGISPSLGPENSEFKNYEREFPPHFFPFQIKRNYFDLWAIARHQLEQLGILPEHIEIASLDTFAHADDFFSYRRQKPPGCHGTLIALL